MLWKKRGHIFTPDPAGWMHSYAQVPTPLVLPDRLRVFVGCRPRQEEGAMPVSQIGYVDLDRADPGRVIGVSEGPVLTLGDLGTFDEFGLHPISVVRRDGEPVGNFDLELPGHRGGTFNTRYFGKLEGVTAATRELYQKAAEKSGKSLHKWLDDVVQDAARRDLGPED